MEIVTITIFILAIWGWCKPNMNNYSEWSPKEQGGKPSMASIPSRNPCVIRVGYFC